MYVPGIRIPYWDWANDRELPTWVYSPPGVTRGPDEVIRDETGKKIGKRILPTGTDVFHYSGQENLS